MVSETQQESTSVHRCHCRILIGLEGAAEADGDQEIFSNKYVVASYPHESDICPREMRSRTCRSSQGARNVNVLEHHSVRARESVFTSKCVGPTAENEEERKRPGPGTKVSRVFNSYPEENGRAGTARGHDPSRRGQRRTH